MTLYLFRFKKLIHEQYQNFSLYQRVCYYNSSFGF